MSTMFRLLNEDGDIEIIENRPRIQYDTDLSKDGAIYDINEYYQTKRHYNIYKMDKELLEKEEEIERLKEKLEVAKTNEETYRLEMLDITKRLGLDEETLFDDVKDKAERLNNIINEALGIANERVNYYSHINKKEILEDWENIFDVLVERDNQELKGSDKE